MVVYFDGSHVLPGNGLCKSRGERVFAWGVVVHDDDVTQEYHGAEWRDGRFRGDHEVFAFLEALLVLRQLGKEPLRAGFYSDDMFVCYAQNYLHHGNHRPTERERVLDRVRRACVAYYDEALFCLAAEVLEKGRFVKVKGHLTTVYNVRADYLAQCAHRALLGEGGGIRPFEEWLQEGFTLYNKQGEQECWFAPFCLQ